MWCISLPAYCQQLEDMIDEKIEALKELRGKAKAFRANMIDEESKSRLLQQKKWASLTRLNSWYSGLSLLSPARSVVRRY